MNKIEENDPARVFLTSDMNIKAIFRVNLTVDYAVQNHSSDDLKKLGDEWFKNENYPIDSYHAYRDGSKIGFSSKAIDYQIITKENIDVPPPTPLSEEEIRKKRYNANFEIANDVDFFIAIDDLQTRLHNPLKRNLMSTIGDRMALLEELQKNGFTITKL